MNRYMWDGSYTVEAAFIVPMVLGIMYAWMFQLFYLHDQMVMDGMLQEMILQPLAEEGADRKAELDDWEEKIQKCLWIAAVDQLDIKQNALVIKGRLSASAVWHIPVMQMFLGNRFQSNITHSISAVQPEKAFSPTVVTLSGIGGNGAWQERAGIAGSFGRRVDLWW